MAAMLTPAEFRLACRQAFPSRDPRTRCPHCRAKLAGRTVIAIAARSCPECGGRVLADAPAPEETVGLSPESEYPAAAKPVGKPILTSVGGGALLWVLSFCIGATLIGPTGLSRLLLPEWL